MKRDKKSQPSKTGSTKSGAHNTRRNSELAILAREAGHFRSKYALVRNVKSSRTLTSAQFVLAGIYFRQTLVLINCPAEETVELLRTIIPKLPERKGTYNRGSPHTCKALKAKWRAEKNSSYSAWAADS